MTKLEKLVERLENMGLKIAKHDLKIHILNNLPRAYDAMVEIIEDNVINYSILKIKSKWNGRYQKLLKRGMEN